MKEFNKGDAVYLLRDWDRKGTVAITAATVYSCGKVQMVLTSAQTGKELGRNFQPTQEQWNFARVTAESDRDKVEAMALEIAGQVLENERGHFAKCAERWSNDANYLRLLQRDIDALHEPRFIWNELGG